MALRRTRRTVRAMVACAQDPALFVIATTGVALAAAAMITLSDARVGADGMAPSAEPAPARAG